jgi:hypothetical protein
MQDSSTKTPLRRPDGQSRGVFDVARNSATSGQRTRARVRWWRIIGLICALAVIVFAVVMLIGWMNGRRKSSVQHPASVPNSNAPAASAPVQSPSSVSTHLRAIDGMNVPDSTPTAGRYYAATIDNLYVARPQSGIDKASVVYEAPVEGGITRFLAVFPDDVTVSQIGPVRSARPYFLDWVSEYDALFAHVGGSPDALDDITAYGLRDMNQFYNGTSFWRATDRSAPHNVYTSTDLLGANYDRYFSDRPPQALDGWKFKDDAAVADRPDGEKVSIAYGDPETDVVWTYDHDTNSYSRAQGGKTIRTLDGADVIAKNVVVQFVDVQVVDSDGRLKIGDIGSGDAIIVFDGQSYHGTWKKDDRTSRTRFYDASGNEIVFDAGTTWIEVVPTGTAVTE